MRDDDVRLVREAIDRGDLKTALAGLRMVPRVDDDYDALLLSGETLFLLKDPAGAKQFFDRAEVVQPTGYLTSYWLGLVTASAGDVDVAIVHFVDALRKNSSHARSRDAIHRLTGESPSQPSVPSAPRAPSALPTLPSAAPPRPSEAPATRASIPGAADGKPNKADWFSALQIPDKEDDRKAYLDARLLVQREEFLQDSWRKYPKWLRRGMVTAMALIAAFVVTLIVIWGISFANIRERGDAFHEEWCRDIIGTMPENIPASCEEYR